MTRDHGTRAAYVIDKCRCDDCTRANRIYERELRNRVEPAYVVASPARRHIEMLAEHGIGLKTIARVSGVSHGALTKIVRGMTKDGVQLRPPSKRIRKATLDKILAVAPSDAVDGNRVDATPIWTLIDKRTTAGVPKIQIARHLGQQGPGLQLGRTTVTAANARAVRQLHNDWLKGRVTFERRDAHGNRHVIPSPQRSRREPADVSYLYNELVEIVQQRREPWRQSAACRGRPVHVWFPTRGDRRTTAHAKKVCNSCIVRQQCLSANLATDDGIYGAQTAQEREDLRLNIASDAS